MDAPHLGRDVAVDNRHDIGARRLADRQRAENPLPHVTPLLYFVFGTVLMTESKKPKSASPPINPAAKTSIEPVASLPFNRSTRVRIAMPTRTAQPAIGFGISNPVASKIPSWRDGPPSHWMIAAGIAQS